MNKTSVLIDILTVGCCVASVCALAYNTIFLAFALLWVSIVLGLIGDRIV